MFLAVLKSMRPKQWTKNVFVMAALVFDRQLTNLDSVLRTLAGVILFCLLSSAVYLFNDVMDLEADRNHPVKRFRPIASGKLSVTFAITFALFLVVVSLIASYKLSPVFILIGIIYFIVNLMYSKWLKHIVILDVLIIAFGFVLRVAAGVSLISVERFSPWLYVCMTLLALYLGFGKRRAELTILHSEAAQHRRVLLGYTIPFLDQMITIVSSTTIIAYSLYTFSAPNLPENHSMMLSIPFVLYAIFRYLYLIQISHAGGSPEELLLTDRPFQIDIFLWGICVFLVFYYPSIRNLI